MKTTINTQREFLQELVESHDFYQNNFKQREYLIKNFERMKSDVPFSSRLNDFTYQWFKQHESIFVFSSEDDFDPTDIKSTLNRYVERYKKTNTIVVNSNNCENSIYGDSLVCLYARCIHEYYHIVCELPYNLKGEILACNLQASLLPDSFLVEKLLINADLAGQFLYYTLHNEYVLNQRKFCISFLKNSCSIFTKQTKL